MSLLQNKWTSNPRLLLLSMLWSAVLLLSLVAQNEVVSLDAPAAPPAESQDQAAKLNTTTATTATTINTNETNAKQNDKINDTNKNLTSTSTNDTPTDAKPSGVTIGSGGQANAQSSIVAGQTVAIAAADLSKLEQQQQSIAINEHNKTIDEIRKSIKQRIEPSHIENRMSLNRPAPISSTPIADFAIDSPEMKIADATIKFGLSFIKNLPAKDRNSNVIISPLSLQNLLNMILLGTADNSTCQQEIIKSLGYDSTFASLLENNATITEASRLKPHAAMRSVLQSIVAATLLPANIDADQQLLNSNQESLVGHLQTSAAKEGEVPLNEQLNFTLANLILTNKDRIELKDQYEQDLKAYYDVKVEQFSLSASNATSGLKQQPLHERVNLWVRNQTQNQIEKLADEADLNDEDLVMVLLNAAHFKGRWLHTFNPKATQERAFYNLGNKESPSKVKFMRKKGVFGYAELSQAAYAPPSDIHPLAGPPPDTRASQTKTSQDSETVLTEDSASGAKKALASVDHKPAAVASSDVQLPPPTIELSKEESRRMDITAKLNCNALQMPFSLNDGQELSMVILLPTKIDGLAELEANLNVASLNEIYSMLMEQQVQVELPKFSFDGSYDAKQALLSMGLKTIFEDGADLDRMLKDGKGKDAKVDKILHKAKISVDETGAEAAAASMATIVLRQSIRPPAPIFVADHPFLFIIRHNRSNMPLFIGKVNKF